MGEPVTTLINIFGRIVGVAAGLTLAGCDDDAFNFLNEFPFVPGPICAGDPDFAPWTGKGRYLGANLNSAGTIWSAPCYHDPDSGIMSPNQCVFGGS